ncbi:MAG TPA: phosphoribosylamine--glycine ligase [Acetobacteraceae bacterium]|nr:phosphoribosylamine--glycine ligase [Acetobacteraceae bacterium]
MRAGVIAGLALLAIAGCARAPAPVADGPPPSPEVAACRAEARQSPETRAVAREMNMNNPGNLLRIREDQAEAEDRAFRDCLRRRNVPMPGGVERVRR